MHSRKLTSGCQWGLSTVGHLWSHCQLCTHALGHAGESLTTGHWAFVLSVLWLRWSTFPKAAGGGGSGGGGATTGGKQVFGEWNCVVKPCYLRGILDVAVLKMFLSPRLPLLLTLGAIVWEKKSACQKYFLSSPYSTFDWNSGRATDWIQWLRRKNIKYVCMSFCIMYIFLYQVLHL